MLSFSDKRNLQQLILEQNKILSRDPSFTVKRQAQKIKAEALIKLGMVVIKQSSNTKSNTGAVSGENSGLQPINNQITRRSTAQFYEFDENRKPAKRKQENTAAMSLIRQIEAGDIDYKNLTDEQKATLAKYSGLGGALVGIDGQKGSDYEYYTPKPIAEGVWNLAKELGFNGGKVLDPSAGVGIFGATAPTSALVDAVELDKTSGMINKLVNGGPGYHAIISPFEKVADSTPDESYDAVLTNVPFGDNSARGANKMFDKRYQKESLQAYFILRSLEKLRPGGIAVFITPPSVVSTKGGREEGLRIRVSYMAEFLGAYRLPNKVFGTAAADTITDVIAFRKYSREMLDKIQELKEQSPQTLIDTNVQWQEFTEGKYFQGEGRRFILGEFVPKDPTKFRDPDKVITNASMGEIGAMLRKFPDSRINWELLNSKETEPIIYQDGDTVIQAGVTMQWRDDKWIVLERTQESEGMLNQITYFSDPYAAIILHRQTYEDASSVFNYMHRSGQGLDIPQWFREAMKPLENVAFVEDRQRYWNAGVIGMACVQVMDQHLAEGAGFNYLEEYPDLSDAMERVASTAKASASKVGGKLKEGMLKIGHVYNKKDGFSALWRGEVSEQVTQVETTLDKTFEGLLYLNKSPWADLSDAKNIYGDNFNPIEDDNFCISADGKRVIRADDYYVGNYGEFLKNINADIEAATDETIKNKLLRQKLYAQSRLDKVDVKSVSFNLFSPHVTAEEKAEFLRRFVHKNAAVVYDESTGLPRPDIDIPGSQLTDREKLIQRMGDYLKNGKISLGGIKISMSTRDALNELRRMIITANEQFDGWAKSNPQIINRLEAKAGRSDALYFKLADDESPLVIPGMNQSLTLHGYQNAYVRKTSRDFSDLNGFNVGLGKTFTSLAAVQYAQAIGVKKKTMFVVPNSVLSNWKKETSRAYASTDDCLFVGLRKNKAGKDVVNSSSIDEDLTMILENRHRKIYVTFETFERIKLRDETIERYENYLESVDAAFKRSKNVKEQVRSDDKKTGILEILSNKKGAAPYFEDMSIDSLVIDESHAYKNSAQTFDFKSAKYLSLGKMSKRGVDAQCKCWYVRDLTPLGDGVLPLTATPITNSPLEVYSMLALTKGHDRVNDMMLSINGADEFMQMFTDIASEDDVSIDGVERVANVFVGLNNVEILRKGINQSMTIKSFDDVGQQIVLPEQQDDESVIALPDATLDRLVLYKNAFRWAIDDLSERSGNRGDADAFQTVKDYFDEPQTLIAHPFNLINKMNLLIMDPDLDKRASFYYFLPQDLEKAKKVVDEFNAKKFTEERNRLSPFTEESSILSKRIREDEDGNEDVFYKVQIVAKIVDNSIVIDTMDPVTQQRWDDMAEKAGLGLDVSIPPKLAALIENVQKEMSSPRGVDDDGTHSPVVKQIIFCDILATHSKIKRLLTKKCGIPANKIVYITGKTNNAPDEILAVQDGFNAFGEDNKYQIVIANEKAEVGINLQKGTQAIHHLTIGWTPDSMIQRNGRGVRQGNKTQKVTVYTYDADGTFDSIKRDMVGKKSDWISSLVKSDGTNKIGVSGGMSKEQLESLIDVTGDSDAMQKVREAIEAKEAESRASTNRAKQKVNLDTIRKQKIYLAQNDPAKNYIIPRIGRLWSIKQQILKIEARFSDEKITATARAKNEGILAELKTRESGLLNDLSSSSIITDNWGGKGVMTADQVISERASGYIKRGENTEEYFLRWLKSRYHVEAIEGSTMHAEWEAETGMAKSMIDQALANYTEQAGQPGSLPVEVAKLFAEGKGKMVGDRILVTGAFLRNNDNLFVVDEKYNAMLIDGRSYSIEDDLLNSIILPGANGYQQALMDAAKLEDDTLKNHFSENNPDVVQFRTTKRIKEYSVRNYVLPSPHIPVVVTPDQAEKSVILKAIFEQQKAVIVKFDDHNNYFFVAYELEVAQIDGSYGTLLYQAVIDFARANKMPLPLDTEEFGSAYFYREALRKVINEQFNYDTDTELLKTKMLAVDDMNAAFKDFVMSKVDFLDYANASAEDIVTMLSQPLQSVFYRASREKELLNQQSTITQENEVAITTSATTTETSLGNEPVGTGDPGETVGISGNTKPNFPKIKSYAGMHGGGKYRWDGKNQVWNVRRITWTKLIEAYPNLTDELKLVPATMRVY